MLSKEMECGCFKCIVVPNVRVLTWPDFAVSRLFESVLSTKALIFDVLPNLLTLDGALLMDDIGCSVI